MFATGLAIYGAMYITARWVPWLMPNTDNNKLASFAIVGLGLLSYALMLASAIELASRYLP